MNTDSSTIALNDLSLNPAAEASLTNCPPDNPPPSVHQDQPHAAWNAQHVKTSPWDMQSLMTDISNLTDLSAKHKELMISQLTEK